jgi:hypothetical protein
MVRSTSRADSFKTTAIDRSAIPPQGHFIRKFARVRFLFAFRCTLMQTTAPRWFARRATDGANTRTDG